MSKRPLSARERYARQAASMLPGAAGGRSSLVKPMPMRQEPGRPPGSAAGVLVLDASPGIDSTGYRALSVHAFPLSTADPVDGVGHANYYECPTGKQALVTVPRIANYAGAFRKAILRVGFVGTDPGLPLVIYNLNSPAGTTVGQPVMMMLGEGDILYAGADGSDVNALIGVKEFAADAGLTSSSYVCAAGDNVVFTCPDGFSATLLDDYGELSPGQILNEGAGNANLKIGVIPDGGSVSYIGGPTGFGGFVGAVENLLPVWSTLSLWGAYMYLGPGDSFVVNSNVSDVNVHTIWRLWPEP